MLSYDKHLFFVCTGAAGPGTFYPASTELKTFFNKNDHRFVPPFIVVSVLKQDFIDDKIEPGPFMEFLPAFYYPTL
jgi:hypothetical protein